MITYSVKFPEVLNPQTIITMLHSFSQLHGAFYHLYADCFGFTANNFTVLVHFPCSH